MQRWHSHRLRSGDKKLSRASCSCGRMPEKSTTSRKDDEAKTTMDQDNAESVDSTTNYRLIIHKMCKPIVHETTSKADEISPQNLTLNMPNRRFGPARLIVDPQPVQLPDPIPGFDNWDFPGRNLRDINTREAVGVFITTSNADTQ
ncbi:hypothetical protein QAD02_014200 [Eretmocerus hayati]|uniref:Uncharacterized protein n=1 Tax=Eretmocerus hayati TaxID=131215 RepID=A0ACC2P4N0_9HYME|nr:hypothetical protein QAD02_014200 [Eretmocerus hayati]